MNPITVALELFLGWRIFRSYFFWIIALTIIGALGLEDIAKYLGMEEQAKPIIAFINQYVDVGDILAKIKGIFTSIPLPETPNQLKED